MLPPTEGGKELEPEAAKRGEGKEKTKHARRTTLGNSTDLRTNTSAGGEQNRPTRRSGENGKASERELSRTERATGFPNTSSSLSPGTPARTHRAFFLLVLLLLLTVRPHRTSPLLSLPCSRHPREAGEGSGALHDPLEAGGGSEATWRPRQKPSPLPAVLPPPQRSWRGVRSSSRPPRGGRGV